LDNNLLVLRISLKNALNIRRPHNLFFTRIQPATPHCQLITMFCLQNTTMIAWATISILVLNVSMTAVLSWIPLTKSICGNRKADVTTTTTTSSPDISHHKKILYPTSLYSRVNSKNAGSGSTAVTIGWVVGPDVATKPDYDNIYGPLGRLTDQLFLRVFRAKLAEHVGFDSNLSQVVFNW
jgi:hypothetical protein